MLTYEQFSRAFYGIDKETNQLYHQLAAHFGLSDSASWILYMLRYANEPMTQTDLCNALYLSKQTVNSTLKNLEKSGYIRLENITGQLRSKYVSLTASGETLAQRAVDPISQMEERVFFLMTEEENAALLSLEQKHLRLLREEAAAILNTPVGG